VELLVTMTIISILAGLTLSGLSGARQRAKIDKTKSTIRKIDSVIRPMYDSYRTRRVSVSGTNVKASAQNVLLAKRNLMLREMPDAPTDVTTVPDFSSLPSYITYRSGKTSEYGSAECLYMILARSGFDPDALEFFRAEPEGSFSAQHICSARWIDFAQKRCGAVGSLGCFIVSI
jgi:type II secretory pathway pseudopilin PulG